MLLPKQPGLFFNISMPEQLNCKDDEAKNKNEKAGSVDPMHVPDPFCFGLIRIGFLKIKILCQLFQ